MAKDLTVIVEDRPGQAAAVCEALGRAGINIDGTFGSHGEIHLLIENAAAARQAIEEAGVPVREERDVLILTVEDRPGAAGEIFRRIANAGVNVDFHYLATNTRLVIAVNDLDKARAAVQ